MIRMITYSGMRLTLSGLLAGGVAAWVIGRFYASLLFGVGPLDPLTYAVTGLGLLAVGLLACAVPAFRAARLAPMKVLQS